jgi:hypothetical protein
MTSSVNSGKSRKSHEQVRQLLENVFAKLAADAKSQGEVSTAPEEPKAEPKK